MAADRLLLLGLTLLALAALTSRSNCSAAQLGSSDAANLESNLRANLAAGGDNVAAVNVQQVQGDTMATPTAAEGPEVDAGEGGGGGGDGGDNSLPITEPLDEIGVSVNESLRLIAREGEQIEWAGASTGFESASEDSAKLKNVKRLLTRQLVTLVMNHSPEEIGQSLRREPVNGTLENPAPDPQLICVAPPEELLKNITRLETEIEERQRRGENVKFARDQLDRLLPDTVQFCSNVTGFMSVETVTQVVVPISFSIIVVAGLVGNILVMLVILEERKTERGLTPTGLLILDLSLADLTFIIFCIPFTGLDYYSEGAWIFGSLWCQLNQYLIVVCALSSIYTLVLMSLDRFLAIVYPIECMAYRTSRNALYAVYIKWIIILVAASPTIPRHDLRLMDKENDSQPIIPVTNDTQPNTLETLTTFATLTTTPTTSDMNHSLADQTFSCRFKADEYSAVNFQIAFFISSYLFPLILILCLYLSLLNKLWYGNKPRGHKESIKTLESKKKVTWLVALIVIVFALCWCPIQIMLIMMRVSYGAQFSPNYVALQVLAHTLGYTNSCINPIVYAFASESFTKSFRRSSMGRLLFRLFGQNHPNHQSDQERSVSNFRTIHTTVHSNNNNNNNPNSNSYSLHNNQFSFNNYDHHQTGVGTSSSVAGTSVASTSLNSGRNGGVIGQDSNTTLSMTPKSNCNESNLYISTNCRTQQSLPPLEPRDRDQLPPPPPPARLTCEETERRPEQQHQQQSISSSTPVTSVTSSGGSSSTGSSSIAGKFPAKQLVAHVAHSGNQVSHSCYEQD